MGGSVGRVGRHPGSGWSVAAGLSIAAALTPPTPAAAAATPITLSPIATGFTHPIGLDYCQPSNKLAMSVNWPGGLPYNFVLMADDGSQSQFSTISGLTDEVYLSAIHAGLCQGGFVTGDVYVGAGTPGVIAKVTDGGSTLIDPRVTLPGESGLLRRGLFQDQFCAAGGDLVVTTTAGEVWRITSGGTATEVATGVGDWLEGPTTVPNGRGPGDLPRRGGVPARPPRPGGAPAGERLRRRDCGPGRPGGVPLGDRHR